MSVSAMENTANERFALGVVIVNFRTPALVEACLTSLLPMLARVNAGVVVVDNASGDGSFECLSDWCASAGAGLDNANRLRVVAAPSNGGFSSGNNIGAQAIDSRLVLFLNSDALAKADALDQLVRAADQFPEAGAFAPRILSSSGEPEVSRFRRHSPLSEFVDGAQTGPITKIFAKAEVPIFPDQAEASADWVSFAAIMVTRDAFEKTGPMDEGFFLYFEDCDYCLRLFGQGYETVLVDEAVFVHDAGGSTQLREKSAQAARLPEYYYQARARYFRKHFGPLGPLAANLGWTTGRMIALVRGLFGRPAPMVNKAKARDIWIGWLGSEPSKTEAPKT